METMDWWQQPRSVQLLVDNDSWILDDARTLCDAIMAGGDYCELRRHVTEIEPGDILFLLGCTQLVAPDVLARNRRNLVVHESSLPRGRGFAPLQWQLLAGQDEIEICLLEAAQQADAGDVYLRDRLIFQGTELSDQIRDQQGRATIDLCLRYLDSDVEPTAVAQSGIPTSYPRRTPVHSQLDPRQTLAEQFDLLRICDNQRYPAWFQHRGQRYVLQIAEDHRSLPNPATGIDQADAAQAAAQDERRFLVAGCKSWNEQSFLRCTPVLPGRWTYLGSRDALTVQRIRELAPHQIFFLHWSWKVPAEILDLTRCICFHMTDLPYGRGGSPLQNLIERGHRTTMLTALQMTSEWDAGPVYLKKPLSLDGSAAEILARASDLSFAMIREIVQEHPQPKPQAGPITKFQRRRPQQSRIAGPASLDRIFDQIRMLDGEGYPAAFIELDGFRYEFSSAKKTDGEITAEVTIRRIATSTLSPPREKSA